MRTVFSFVLFIGVCALCSLPVAWAAARIRVANYLSGYNATDWVLVRNLWIFFSLLLLAGGWLQLIPRRGIRG